MDPSDLEKCSIYFRKKVLSLRPVFAKAAIGDFSENVTIPDEDDEFTEFYVGIQIMLEVIREKISDYEKLNAQLESKVMQRTLALDQSRKELREFIDNMSTLSAKIAPDGKLLIVNKVAGLFSGLSKEKLYKTNFLDGPWWGFDPQVKARVSENFKKALAGEKISYEEKLLAFGNNVVTILFSLVPIRDASGKVSYIIAEGKDITERKMATEELVRLLDLKSNFLDMTSHELKTPITPVLVQLELMSNGFYGELNEKQKKSLQMILRNIKRLYVIISNISETSRISRKKLGLNITKNNVSTLIHNSCEDISMSSLLKSKKVRLVVYAKKSLPKIMVDKERFEQVMVNLLDNAVKFSKENGKIIIKAEEAKKAGKKFIKVSVKDQGIGIPPEKQHELFTPFYQVEEFTRSRKFGGTGLGLSICKSLVELMGGTIGVKSLPKKGSTFFFLIPLKVLIQQKENVITVG